MNGAEHGDTRQSQINFGEQQPLPSGAAAQWAQNVAGMQALYKQSQPPGAPYMPPSQLAAYYANAAQLTPLLYNAHMINGLGGIPNPYAFMPGAIQQNQQAVGGEPSPVQPQAAPVTRELDQQEFQEGGSQKRRKRERSTGDLKLEQSEPSRFSRSQSPGSEPGSEQIEPQTDGALGSNEAAAQLLASNSGLNLAASGGPLNLQQDEREVKKMRRKQSNRESARRSRLRKQAECEALSGKVVELQNENLHLKQANRALLARIEELVAKLEQKSGPQGAALVKISTGDSALTPFGAEREGGQPAEGSIHLPSNPSQPSTQTIESTFAEPAVGTAIPPADGIAAS